MKQETCCICGENWVMSTCTKIYYVPADTLQYFTRDKESDSKGCPACDSDQQWTYRVFSSLDV